MRHMLQELYYSALRVVGPSEFEPETYARITQAVSNAVSAAMDKAFGEGHLAAAWDRYEETQAACAERDRLRKLRTTKN